MKHFIRITLVCMAMTGLFACSSRKSSVKNRVRYERQRSAHERSRLSQRFGVRLTPADNLRLYDACSRWLGVPYRYGGNSRSGVDCSGLVSILYRQIYGVATERTASGILRKNCIPITRGNLREGDLVFFNTSSGASKTASHVGIYLKSGKFIHASASRGVIVSRLSEPYYARRWITGGRVPARRTTP